jgi:hypothetical protein
MHVAPQRAYCCAAYPITCSSTNPDVVSDEWMRAQFERHNRTLPAAPPRRPLCNRGLCSFGGDSYFPLFMRDTNQCKRRQTSQKAEINEETCETLHLTISFSGSLEGRIAIRVINHYNDEILKVFDTKDTRLA